MSDYVINWLPDKPINRFRFIDPHLTYVIIGMEYLSFTTSILLNVDHIVFECLEHNFILILCNFIMK